MTPERLVEIGDKRWGYGWQTKMAGFLKTDVSTIRRWIGKKSRIPGPADVALEQMMETWKPAPPASRPKRMPRAASS